MTIYDKILLRTPVLYTAIIDDFVDNRKYRNRTDFINEAIKQKLEKEFGSLEPTQEIELKEWWDEKDDPKIYKQNKVI